MKTTIKNKKLIALLTRAFDSNGYLINPRNIKNRREAQAFLDSKTNYYAEYWNGHDVHNCLLIISNPYKSI